MIEQQKSDIAVWLQQISRPEIWDMSVYSSARQEFADCTNMIQLDANESPFSPYAYQIKTVSKFNRYPNSQPISVISRMAAIYGVNTDQVLIGRGMDEIIDLLVRVFCIPYKDKIVYTPPTFGYYRVAADIAGVGTVEVPLDEQFNLDVDGLLNLCNLVKIVFLCTPNNPTGNIVDITVIEKIAKNLPHSIIAVDEAYLEFAETVSATSLLNKYPNLVVMRTLSKAYACAGVRVGALIAHPAIIRLVSKILPPYPIPTPCSEIIAQALSPFGIDLANSQIKLLKQERTRMYELFSRLPDIIVYPSQANFLLLKLVDASVVYKDLLSRGIIVRNRSRDISNTLRISIGTPKENNLVLAALGVNVADVRCGNISTRQALVIRKTNETDIMVRVDLDTTAVVEVNTGIGFFDHMLEQLARHGEFSLQLRANGDTHIDYHHTVEDVAIALGQALKQALGDKRGINRYGFVLPMDEACAFAAIDLSGRGVLMLDAKFITPMIGDFPVEMVEHFFLSMSDQLEAAIHLKVTGTNSHHMVEGLFKACARALGQAIKRRESGGVYDIQAIPSTKGVL
ncbi:MAG: histidinol-phosphate aminotransferase [Pseudomonadota bacterium]|nr:histidinol-phosphate aminotransferase [Pseudomonadota bacterium]